MTNNFVKVKTNMDKGCENLNCLQTIELGTKVRQDPTRKENSNLDAICQSTACAAENINYVTNLCFLDFRRNSNAESGMRFTGRQFVLE